MSSHVLGIGPRVDVIRNLVAVCGSWVSSSEFGSTYRDVQGSHVLSKCYRLAGTSRANIKLMVVGGFGGEDGRFGV